MNTVCLFLLSLKNPILNLSCSTSIYFQQTDVFEIAAMAFSGLLEHKTNKLTQEKHKLRQFYFDYCKIGYLEHISRTSIFTDIIYNDLTSDVFNMPDLSSPV